MTSRSEIAQLRAALSAANAVAYTALTAAKDAQDAACRDRWSATWRDSAERAERALENWYRLDELAARARRALRDAEAAARPSGANGDAA